MIESALEYTKDCLSERLKNQFGTTDSKVILNGLVDVDGRLHDKNNNKVVVTLLNLEEETAKPYYDRYRATADGKWKDKSPPLRLNVDLLITSIFGDYKEALKFLDAAIGFFQVNPVLTANNFANIPPGIEKLEFDIEKVNYFNMHSLWSAMGAKYQPSVIYKMRLISYQGDQEIRTIPSVESTPETVVS